jgi:putative membrane protein
MCLFASTISTCPGRAVLPGCCANCGGVALKAGVEVVRPFNSLTRLTGAAFDKAYVDNEVATVTSALSTTLIPSAQTSELKSLLQNGLKVSEDHLEHAERLAQQLHSAKP